MKTQVHFNVVLEGSEVPPNWVRQISAKLQKEMELQFKGLVKEVKLVRIHEE